MQAAEKQREFDKRQEHDQYVASGKRLTDVDQDQVSAARNNLANVNQIRRVWVVKKIQKKIFFRKKLKKNFKKCFDHLPPSRKNDQMKRTFHNVVQPNNRPNLPQGRFGFKKKGDLNKVRIQLRDAVHILENTNIASSEFLNRHYFSDINKLGN